MADKLDDLVEKILDIGMDYGRFYEVVDGNDTDEAEEKALMKIRELLRGQSERLTVTRGDILDFLFKFTGWKKVSDTHLEVFEGWLKSKGIEVVEK